MCFSPQLLVRFPQASVLCDKNSSRRNSSLCHIRHDGGILHGLSLTNGSSDDQFLPLHKQQRFVLLALLVPVPSPTGGFRSVCFVETPVLPGAFYGNAFVGIYKPLAALADS